MKLEIAKLWASELRSGKYQQGTAYLKNGNTYCCLGVLCEISNLSTFEHSSKLAAGEYLGNDTHLPIEVGEWSGMRNGGDFWEEVKESGIALNGYVCLSKANDTGVSFIEIADFIEANYQIL